MVKFLVLFVHFFYVSKITKKTANLNATLGTVNKYFVIKDAYCYRLSCTPLHITNTLRHWSKFSHNLRYIFTCAL